VTIELRPPRLEDAPGLAAVFAEFGRTYGADHGSQRDIESWFTNPGMNPDRDARIALIDGEIAGYGDVGDAGRDGRMIYLDLRLDPERLDTAALALFDFVEARAAELTRPGSVVKVWSPERAEGLRRLIEGRGYGPRTSRCGRSTRRATRGSSTRSTRRRSRTSPTTFATLMTSGCTGPSASRSIPTCGSSPSTAYERAGMKRERSNLWFRKEV
jgi:hypothetical protein